MGILVIRSYQIHCIPRKYPAAVIESEIIESPVIECQKQMVNKWRTYDTVSISQELILTDTKSWTHEVVMDLEYV